MKPEKIIRIGESETEFLRRALVDSLEREQEAKRQREQSCETETLAEAEIRRLRQLLLQLAPEAGGNAASGSTFPIV